MAQFSIFGTGTLGIFGAGKTTLKKNLEISLTSKAPTQQENKNSLIPVSTKLLETFIPTQKLRRTDHLSRLAMTALYLALEDADLLSDQFEDCGLLLASGYGPATSTCSFKDSYMDHGPLGASPLMFTKSVQNQAGAHIAMNLGLKGPVATICQLHFPFQVALLTGCLWLQEKRVKRVLVGGVDEYSPFLDHCRQRYLQENREPKGSPLATPEALPGEGATFFVLEERMDDSKATLELPVLGKVRSEDLSPAGQDLVVMTGFHDGRPSSPDKSNSHPYIDPRSVYGNFPTAAALDLASLMLLLPKNGKGNCLELGPENLFGSMKLWT